MDALILVDVQNDFMPFGALPVPGGDDVVSVANRLAHAFQLVVASQDWHPPGHGSFATAHTGAVAGDIVELGGAPQVLWPDHCVQQLPGASFHSALDVTGIGHVVQKGIDAGIDSYSAFFDNNHARDTGLSGLLRSQGVSTVFLLGLATDYCVKYTALDAREIGFDVTIVTDGCRAVDLTPGDGERALEEMRAAGCRMLDSDQVLQLRG